MCRKRGNRKFTSEIRLALCAVLACALAAQPLPALATSNRQQMEQERDKAQQG